LIELNEPFIYFNQGFIYFNQGFIYFNQGFIYFNQGLIDLPDKSSKLINNLKKGKNFMSNKGDYLPSKDSELVVWGDNFASQIASHYTEWEIPTQDLTDLQASLDLFKSLHDQADSPAKNKIIVAEKNAARKAFKEKVRGLVNFRLKNPVITNAQRVALGLRVRDTTPSKIPVPTTRPELDVDVLDVRRLRLRFHDMGSSNNARPYGVNGAVVAYAVRDTPPSSPNDLTRTVLATRTPFTLEFTEEERGKTVYFAICWQNERGERGPWSEIESAIVP
jgi:hypothetical protein